MPTSMLDRFAANMRRIRAERHLSQSQLAAAAGCAPGYISMLERAQRDPPLSTVDQIARGLGCTADALLAPLPARNA